MLLLFRDDKGKTNLSFITKRTLQPVHAEMMECFANLHLPLLSLPLSPLV